MICSLQGWSPAKRRKIRDTFLSFCDIVLSYTQYSSARSQVYVRYSNLSMLDFFKNTVYPLRIEIVVLLVVVLVRAITGQLSFLRLLKIEIRVIVSI